MTAGDHSDVNHDTAATNSVVSTPSGCDDQNHDDVDATTFQPRIRFMCSFGGKILPRPDDNQLRYVGGDTRIVSVDRNTSFSLLLSKLAKLQGMTDITIKYQLPNEDLDALITVTGDDDVENMMEEYDRAALSHKSVQLRLFLFPKGNPDVRVSNIDLLLDGSSKRDNWFVDALNRGGSAASPLERGRSEVSSIVPEVPDHLFGLDNPDVASKSAVEDDVLSASDPGSPGPVTSSRTGLPIIPDLLPLKTRPNIHPIPHEYKRESLESPISHPTAFSSPPIYHHQSQAVQSIPAMYYVPVGNSTVHPQFVQSFPVGFRFPIYGACVRQPEFPIGYVADNPLYYGATNVTVVPGSYPSMIVHGGEEIPISGCHPGRIS